MPRYVDPKRHGDQKGVTQKIGIHVQRGRDLVNEDVIGLSDPYVAVRMGKQELKTHVVDDDLNPEWDCHLTLSISDPRLPVQLFVYDKDPIKWDDPLGDAVIDIKPFLAAMGESKDTAVKNKQASPQNCQIERKDGKLVQNMSLKLQHVKSGKVELQLYAPLESDE